MNTKDIRQTVGNNIYEGLGGGILGTAGNIAYQGIMGVGDYGLATMTGLGIVLMGMEGYAQTEQDAAERGLSASDIQAEAVAGAIAEIITERILSGIPGGKSAASHGIQLLKAGASNAVNNAIVWQLDKYIAEELSYEELLLQSYIAAGEGKEEARQQVIQDRLKQAAMDFGVGAVTAGIVDVAKTAVQVEQASKTSLKKDELLISNLKFLNANGDVDWEKWAPNGGRVPGTEKAGQRLEVGTIIDRYGNQYGKYTSPEGVPYEQRALPYVENPNAYHRYKVLKPIDNVTISEIAAAFEQPGGGIQYELPASIKQLIKDGYLKDKIMKKEEINKIF